VYIEHGYVVREMVGKQLIAPSDLVVHKEHVLGTGGSGQVYKGTLRDQAGKRTVAVKVLEQHGEAKGPPHEYRLLRKALEKCPYVCRPLGYCVKDGMMCVVLHHYEKSLAQFIKEGNCIPTLICIVIECSKDILTM
jgi:hypothetical protein